MAHNAHGPQGPQEPDPAGSTQMFRAFVNEDPAARQPAAASSSGPRIGVILGIAALITVLVVVAWLAFS